MKGKEVNRHLLRLCALFASAFLFVSCSKWPGYHEIQWHGQGYYVELARACNSLLSKTNHVSGEKIRGDDPSLPKPILDLHATKLVINKDVPLIGATNRLTNVGIIFGKGRPDYVIWWQLAEYDDGHCAWELAVARDGEGETLFSTTNLSVLDTEKAN